MTCFPQSRTLPYAYEVVKAFPHFRVPLFLAAITINKFLLCSKGRVMCFARAVHHLEVITKFAVQTFRAIAHNLQPAATLWPVRSKRRDNDVPAFSDRVPYNFYIALSVFGLG